MPGDQHSVKIGLFYIHILLLLSDFTIINLVFMTKYVLLPLIALLSVTVSAQTTNPKIGTEKGVKEKLTRIKNGLPDIKKNLTKEDDWGDIDVKFEMGNGTILFDEDEDDHKQSLSIRYTYSYYSGTTTDYQNYYKTLVVLIKEVFGDGYESKTNDSEKSWSTFFYEKGKRRIDSNISIWIKCSWVLDLLSIDIDISSKVK